MTGAPDTIPALLEARVLASGDRPWLFFEGDTFTLRDVCGEADRTAVGLAERGVGHGDRVATLLGNRPDTLFTWFGANRLGAVFFPLNHGLKAVELAGLLSLARPRVLVCAEEHRALAEAACAALVEGRAPAIATPEALRSGGEGAPRAPVEPGDVAVLLGTSGTTGVAKAVMQTHRTYALTAEALPDWIGITEADRLLVALPLFHVNAQAYSTMGSLGAGASLALLPRFSASRFWEEARRLGATEVNAVGAMVRILAKGPPKAADREHGLRCLYTALALPEAEHRAFEARFGVAMTVGYGLSESTFGTVWPRSGPAPYGTMGVLRQHPRLGVVNRARVVRDDGAEAQGGEAGELWLSNPATMKGYWDDPAQTAAALEGPWLKTGDLVRRDAAGSFTFVARKKDVLRRRGENVAAAEIEAALMSCPGVREAAAVGVPAELGEDDIVAYVSLDPGATVGAEAILAWAAERLADFKVPREVRIRDALPRTATERVAKHLLK